MSSSAGSVTGWSTRQVGDRIEHHQAVWRMQMIIDLGRRAARRRPGGLEGTLAELVADRSTPAGEHLAGYVGA
jgi:hypothetical protein